MEYLDHLDFWEWLEREVPAKNPLADDVEEWFNKQAEEDKEYYRDEYRKYKKGYEIRE